MIDMIETTQKVTAFVVAPQIGKRYTFVDTSGNLYLCQVDRIQDAKVWAFVENAQAWNGWSYQRVDRLTLCEAPAWLEFSRAVDWSWIEYMRDDQLTPEQDEEFIRNEYLARW